MEAVTQTEAFLGHVFSGEMNKAIDMVAPEARFIGSRPEASVENPLFGTHVGPDGARAFFQAFGELLEPGVFEIAGKFGSDKQACFFGRFEHTVRSTGRPFPSDWALVTEVSDGKLVFYHFYEDTAALSGAMQ